LKIERFSKNGIGQKPAVNWQEARGRGDSGQGNYFLKKRGKERLSDLLAF
jgi:hypothetical protein